MNYAYNASKPNNRPQQSDLHATVNMRIGGEPIPANVYLQSFTFTEKTQGSYTGEVVFFDSEWGVIEDFILRKGHGTFCDFSFGFRGNMSPFFRMRTGSYTPVFDNSGVTLTLQLTDDAELKNLIGRSKGYPLNQFKRIYDIVVWLAIDNKWDFLVEPTKNHNRPFTQNNEPDTHFLLRLREQAVNKKNVGAYLCYFESGGRRVQTAEPRGTLHFHTADYLLQTRGKIYRTYNFARDRDGEVLSFTPKDNTLTVAAMGGKNANYECYDPRTKKRVVYKHTKDGYKKMPVKGGGKVPDVTGEPGNPLNRWITRPFSSPEELERYALNRWTAYNQQTFTATMELLGDPFLEPLHYVVVNIYKANGQIYPRWSGTWLVNKEVTHTIEAGKYTTTCALHRESNGETDDDEAAAESFKTVEVQGHRITLNPENRISGGTAFAPSELIKPVMEPTQ